MRAEDVKLPIVDDGVEVRNVVIEPSVLLRVRLQGVLGFELVWASTNTSTTERIPEEKKNEPNKDP